MNRIACTHPGRLGDCLYSLPTVKRLCEIHNTTCDFYTSEYCLPLRKLFQNQSYISNFHVLKNYKVAHHCCGTQPWHMDIPNLYDEKGDVHNPWKNYSNIFQLGFHSFPDCELHKFIARSVGINEDLPIEYEFEDIGFEEEEFNNFYPKYIVLAARAANSSFNSLLKEVCDKLSINVPIFEIGRKEDMIYQEGYAYHGETPVKTIDFYDCLPLLHHAKCFIGLMSSQLVLANGFPKLPKICIYGDVPADMRHVIKSPTNHYLDKPNAEYLTRFIKQFIN